MLKAKLRSYSPYLESEHTKVIIDVLRIAQLVNWVRLIDGR